MFNTRRRSLLSTPDPIVIGLFLPAGFLSLVAGVLEARTALKLAKAQTATRGRVGAEGATRTADGSVPVACPPRRDGAASAELMPTTTATKPTLHEESGEMHECAQHGMCDACWFAIVE